MADEDSFPKLIARIRAGNGAQPGDSFGLGTKAQALALRGMAGLDDLEGHQPL
jgi:hypothetical protein